MEITRGSWESELPEWYVKLRTKREESLARSPFGVRAWNGMNLSKSITNPKSRLSRIVNYIRQNGAAEKRVIFYNVFGKEIVEKSNYWNPSTYRYDVPTNKVTRSWGCYVWNLAVAGNVLVKVRRGNRVFYELGVNSNKVI